MSDHHVKSRIIMTNHKRYAVVNVTYAKSFPHSAFCEQFPIRVSVLIADILIHQNSIAHNIEYHEDK